MKNSSSPHPKLRPVAVAAVLLLAIVLGLAAFAYTQTGSPAAVAKRTAALPRFGIAAGSGLSDLSDSQLDARMSAIQATGSGWVRFDFDWSQIQPDSQNSYDWSEIDKLVTSATSHKLKVIGLIDFTPAWARPTGCTDAKQCAPANLQAYAHFAGQLSQRYKSQGLHYWEIWNEPNTTAFWQPKPNAAAYTHLLQAAHHEIHLQDRQAIVITGGTAPAASDGSNLSPTDFLSGIYASSGKSSIDAVGAHPYTYPRLPSTGADQAWAQMAANPTSLRSIMVKNGDQQKKIWITEFGAPTGGPGPTSTAAHPDLDQQPWHVDENLQTDMVITAINLYRSYDWTGPFLWYSYQDDGTTTDTNENFFGLVRADGSHKPAYDTFKQAIAAPAK